MGEQKIKSEDRDTNENQINNAFNSKIAKRSEILFFYDARMSNPNGDPDENRPRIDKITKKNYVTEFRLKRTVRDYLSKVKEKKIFMRAELLDSKSLLLKQLEDLAKGYINGEKKEKKIDRKKLIEEHIDIKLFGILFAVQGLHFKQTGPVQFSIGQSLNEVEEISVRMTRIVPNTKTEQKALSEASEDESTVRGARSGTFGEKSVVRYSFIQFHGFVNNHIAREYDVQLTEDEIKLMIEAMWKGTDSLSTSSKYGQKSRLLVKVNYIDDGYIGDLDLKCKLIEKKNTLENIFDITLDVKGLIDVIEKNIDLIGSIEYYEDIDLNCRYNEDETKTFGEIISNLNSNNLKDKFKMMTW